MRFEIRTSSDVWFRICPRRSPRIRRGSRGGANRRDSRRVGVGPPCAAIRRRARRRDDARGDATLRRRLVMTPLYWAAQNGHEAVARILIEAGADAHEGAG